MYFLFERSQGNAGACVWLTNKKSCKSISRILYPAQRRTTIIYLRWLLPTTCICLPWTIRRAALKRSYTWHFSTQGLPVATVTSNNRGLLPHVFILTLCVKHRQGGYFLWHCLVPAWAGSPAVSGMRCSVLSGLSL